MSSENFHRITETDLADGQYFENAKGELVPWDEAAQDYVPERPLQRRIVNLGRVASIVGYATTTLASLLHAANGDSAGAAEMTSAKPSASDRVTIATGEYTRQEVDLWKEKIKTTNGLKIAFDNLASAPEDEKPVRRMAIVKRLRTEEMPKAMTPAHRRALLELAGELSVLSGNYKDALEIHREMNTPEQYLTTEFLNGALYILRQAQGPQFPFNHHDSKKRDIEKNIALRNAVLQATPNTPEAQIAQGTYLFLACGSVEGLALLTDHPDQAVASLAKFPDDAEVWKNGINLVPADWRAAVEERARKLQPSEGIAAAASLDNAEPTQQASAPKPEAKPSATAAKPSPVAPKPAGVDARKGRWFDVFKDVPLNRGVIAGDPPALTPQGLILKPFNNAGGEVKYQIPIIPNKNFGLHLEIGARTGAGKFGIVLPVAKGECIVHILPDGASIQVSKGDGKREFPDKVDCKFPEDLVLDITVHEVDMNTSTVTVKMNAIGGEKVLTKDVEHDDFKIDQNWEWTMRSAKGATQSLGITSVQGTALQLKQMKLHLQDGARQAPVVQR